MINLSRGTHFALMLAPLSLLVAACVQGGLPEDYEELGELDDAIINGTVPASTGALSSYGVVRSGNLLMGICSGTMLTNRHVLTAHHCTGRRRSLFDWTGNLYAPGALPIMLETPAGQLNAANLSFIEPSQPWSDGANDYSIIVLDRPLEPGGVSDMFYNRIYSGSDASLANKTVKCMGYGGTYEATPTTASGGYFLTSANLVIASGTGGLLRINRQNNVVQFGGDSGSTCFSNGLITGVASTCYAPTYYDLNNNNLKDGWNEVYGVPYCESAAPSNFRTFVADNIMGSVSLHYDTVPTLPAGTTLGAVVTTTAGQTAINALATTSVTGPRSGRVTSVVATASVYMVCPEVQTQVPMSGTLTLGGTCLDAGLMNSLVGG